MKKLILTLFVALSTAAGFADTNYIDTLFVTNLWSADPLSVLTNYVRLRPGIVNVFNRSQAIVGMETYSGGAAYGAGSGELSFQVLSAYPNGHYCGFNFDTNLTVANDLWVDGNILCAGYVIGATNVLNVTNVYSTTNSFYYPTNSAALAVNLGTTYGDLQVDGSVSVAFTIDPLSVVADVYQTAVVLVRNTSGVATNITAANMHIQGTPWVTNRTVCTFFHHNLTGDTFTNMTVLPLW